MIRSWIKAARLRTLPLAWAALTMGATLAYLEGAFHWNIYLLSLLTAFSLQILSNFANDYGDARSGLDGEHRAGPSRTIQDGLISSGQMKVAILIMIILSLGSGVLLVLNSLANPQIIVVFLCLGLASIVAAMKYTMGKNPYGYTGWGDFFVLVFFGWLGVGGSYYLFTGFIDWAVLLPASSLGLMAVGVLNVNNIRDIESDRQSGKYSIPVRIGRDRAIIYHGIILISAVLLMVGYSVIMDHQGSDWTYLLVLPLLIKNWNGVRSNSDAEKLDPFLKQMALTTLALVVLFILGTVVLV